MAGFPSTVLSPLNLSAAYTVYSVWHSASQHSGIIQWENGRLLTGSALVRFQLPDSDSLQLQPSRLAS